MAPRSREELLAYGIPDPLFEAELAARPMRDPQPSDPYFGRDDFFAMREHRATRLRESHHLRYLPGPIPDQVREEDRKITARDGHELVVRIYTPVKAPREGSPLIVMYHEGGWSSGDLSDEEVNCRLFSRDLGAVCVNVDYRSVWLSLSLTLSQAAENASNLNADPSRGFIIGGGSAGGNIVAVLAHLARDDELSPPVTGQYLCVPAIMCFLPPEAIPERYRSEYLSHPSVTPCKDPVVGPNMDEKIAGAQAILRPDMESPLFVPFHSGRVGQGHKGLPPAYFQVAGLDPLRDEALIYEHVLREEAGVKTKLDIYPGLPHYFWTNFPRLEASKKFVEDTVKGVRWLLQQQ
ncbi:Lipase 2 [Colletotrichum higginsianum IMI 349063]|uniref:Lipase 2 n=2 Tax=Colletotrichum higginsianum (strain IMI 349063) TaxID=759273 RepID=A0A1B7XVX1_COLHI|nr:Lipase 2 [Colletotrichum higginsianum IMI 349063]OBR03932.1 Lipase 2 [Colletotrichum higginsianum IMI 349063]